MRLIIGTMFIILFLFTGPALAEKKASFPDLLKPGFIQVYEDELFINEGPSIFIYSLKDYGLKKKIGKEGEGPREFKLSILGLRGHLICLNIFPDSIVVSSERKISYFSRQGEFVREKRLPISMVIDLTPLEKGFVGRSYKTDGNTPYFSIDLYNPDGEIIKQVCKHQIPHYKEGNMVLWHLVSKIPEFKTNGELIFVAGGGEFIIDVYNTNGKKLKSIKRQYQRQKISDSQRKEIINIWKQDFPTIRRQWDVFKKMIKVPQYFPAFRTFSIADNKVYVQTCHVEKGKTEFAIFAVDGTFEKQVFLPIRYRNMLTHFPYTIAGDKLYQLIENEETEIWELLVTKIE